MGHFVSTELVRIELEDGEWVDIKSGLSLGDYEKIAIESDSDRPEGRIVATLLVVIKAWNLKDDGKDMPINRDSIERLDQDLAVRIITEVGKHNKGLVTNQKKD